MMMKKCVYCGRENADDAGACVECGTPLASKGNAALTSQSHPFVSSARTEAEKRMLHGALWCGDGIFVTGITYLGASGGGIYVVAWGAIVFGAFRFIQGYTARNASNGPPSLDDSGYDALDYVTRLETEGRVQEAMAGYQKIVECYGNRPVGLDAQKSLDSLKAKLGP
jgi:hypothetical protein